MVKRYLGETIGTLILVFFGCGSVGMSVLFDAFSLFEIAFVWCLAVTFGIFASRGWSDGHLNPAVSIAMLLAGKIEKKELLPYVFGQFSGAFLASCLLFALLNPSIEEFELSKGIVRGSRESIATAKMFGEYFSVGAYQFTLIQAFLAETIGTFFLVFMIFRLCSEENEHKFLTPFYIGFVVAVIICVVAPITQAGLNPARDLAPRIFSYFAGWGNIVFTHNLVGWWLVYVIGPIVGGVVAHFLNRILLFYKS